MKRLQGSATGQVAWDPGATAPVELSVGRYTDPAWFEGELTGLWPKVWQFACSTGHLADPGDFYEYRAGSLSVMIVRDDDGRLAAFQNVCRHRGNALCEGSGGGLTEIRCPYHRWSWTLNGELREVPSRRGFGSLRNDDLPLIRARVDTWGPLVFVCVDFDAPPLAEYLEGVPGDCSWARIDEFECSMTTRTPVSCNWKIVSEGFSESYHVQGIHPELLASVDDVNAPQHIWDHHGVSYQLYGVPSPRISRQVSPREVWESFVRTQPLRLGLTTGRPIAIPEGYDECSGGEVIAGEIRRHHLDRGCDLSDFSDSQIMTTSQYNLFPNTSALISADDLMVLTARPGAHVGDAELMSWHFSRRGEGGPTPRPTDIVNERDAAALGVVFNQDVAMMHSMQRGLSQPGLTHLTVSSEEIRVINAHRVMDRYVASP